MMSIYDVLLFLLQWWWCPVIVSVLVMSWQFSTVIPIVWRCDLSLMKVPDVGYFFCRSRLGSRLITIPCDRFRFLPPTWPHVSVRDLGSRLITTPRGCFASSGSGFVRSRSGSGFYPLPPRRLSSSFSASCSCQCSWQYYPMFDDVQSNATWWWWCSFSSSFFVPGVMG